MQILKKEKQEIIVLAAKEEFRSKNYKVASMRSIANKCGISVSNLYNYFPNKMELYTFIVNPVKIYFNGIFKQFIEFESKYGFSDAKFIDFVVEKFSLMLTIYGQEFIILMESGQGTQYSDFKEVVIDEITEHFVEHTNDRSYRKLMRIIATNFINGIIEVAKLNENRREKSKLLKQFLQYHFCGILELF